MRRAQRAIAGRGAALGVPIRRHFPPGHALQAAQSRQRLVLDPRSRMAGAESRLRALARAGQFRSGQPAAITGEPQETVSFPLTLSLSALSLTLARLRGREGWGARRCGL